MKCLIEGYGESTVGILDKKVERTTTTNIGAATFADLICVRRGSSLLPFFVHLYATLDQPGVPSDRSALSIHLSLGLPRGISPTTSFVII